MNQPHTKPILVLGISLSTRGCGFAVFDGEHLGDFGVKTVEANKNEGTLAKVAGLIEQYRPDVLALEDVRASGSRRKPRIVDLHKEILDMARNEDTQIKVFPRTTLMKFHLKDGELTNYALATKLACEFPDDLAHKLPKPRRAWTSEDSRMDIFKAVALAGCAKGELTAQSSR